jgi:hypothetical protein
MSQTPIAKILIISGAAILILGVALLLFDRISVAGKFPGDIVVRRKSFTLYFPLVTSILISLILTLVLFVLNIFRK